MTLSPEVVISDVLDKDLRVMVRNFQKRYSGKRIGFTETVVRKNPREQLLVFKGGGFLATAYDVQVSLDEQQNPGFNSVNVGARISIVGTLERIRAASLWNRQHLHPNQKCADRDGKRGAFARPLRPRPRVKERRAPGRLSMCRIKDDSSVSDPLPL